MPACIEIYLKDTLIGRKLNGYQWSTVAVILYKNTFDNLGLHMFDDISRSVIKIKKSSENYRKTSIGKRSLIPW